MNRKCKSCFRYIEDWRDARDKGLKVKKYRSLAYLISYKPRPGVATLCIGKIEPPHEPDGNGCNYHRYRWSWNLEMWWKWSVVDKLRRWFETHIRCPLGGLRKPIKLKWIASYDPMKDEITRDGEPKCPHCGEMPYSLERCVFCGQRFTTDAENLEVKDEQIN